MVKKLQEAFRDADVATLCHDYYYKAHPELSYEERTKLNYDHPAAFDTDMLVEHIRTLKSNVPIEHPVYSFVDHNRTDERVLVKPSRVIIVDGILIFENKELRELMDIKVFVDTDADIRLARRILRDVCERGRTMQSVIDQYTTPARAQQPIRLAQRPGLVAGDEEGALGDHGVKAAVRVRGAKEVPPFHLRRARRAVDPPGLAAERAEKRKRLSRAGAHVQHALAARKLRQRDQAAAVRLAAGMELHLSSSARSTDATLPSASSSGT